MSDTTEKQEENLCEVTGKSRYECPCLDCEPLSIDTESWFIDSRTLEELMDRTRDLLEYLTRLQNSGFEIRRLPDSTHVRIIPPLVDDSYWVKCDGCFCPLLVEPDEDPFGWLCNSCYKKASTWYEGMPQRYYGDLFDYLGFILSPEGREMRSAVNLEGDLPFVREFCECHGFDFEIIKTRLKATGGYDEGEVLMNSTMSIPRFDSLPIKRDIVDGGCDEE
ncbi:MAG: hypothetical protein RTU92_04255 [Candidatus Thorarchaeota archaeon]